MIDGDTPDDFEFNASNYKEIEAEAEALMPKVKYLSTILSGYRDDGWVGARELLGKIRKATLG